MTRDEVHELALDPTKCEAHGFCAELLASLLTLDEFGYPILADGGLTVAVPTPLIRDARRAVHACPAGALRLLTRT